MQWEGALHEFYRFSIHSLPHVPNTVAFSAAISACETCGQWLRAMHLFEAGPWIVARKAVVKMWYTHGIPMDYHPNSWNFVLRELWSTIINHPSYSCPIFRPRVAWHREPKDHEDVLLGDKVPKGSLLTSSLHVDQIVSWRSPLAHFRKARWVG